MQAEELTFVRTCDIAGLVRGKGFPSGELESRRKTGIGWTHSNLMQTCFGPIFDTPFGTGGDLMIVPDASAEMRVDFDKSAPGAEVEHFFLGDICNTDGSPWECCRARSCAGRSRRSRRWADSSLRAPSSRNSSIRD
jgi:glutamine synthetase